MDLFHAIPRCQDMWVACISVRAACDVHLSQQTTHSELRAVHEILLAMVSSEDILEIAARDGSLDVWVRDLWL